MTASTHLRRLAASTAVALAFAPMAGFAADAPAKPQTACEAAQTNSGPLLANSNAMNCYRGTFSRALASAAPNYEAPRIRAGAFMFELEKALAAPTEKTQTIVYPRENSTNMLVVAAIVPPKGFETLPIPVCAQQHARVLGTWNITSKGEVIPRPIIVNPEGSTKAACAAFMTAARAEMNDKLHAVQPAQPPAAAVSDAGTATTLAAPRP